MRITIIALLLFVTTYNSYAGTGVSPKEAKTVAETYYRYNTTYSTAIGKIAHVDKDANGNILYYIVNMDKTGFVIVSGTTVAHPIVAISTHGNYKAIPQSGVEDYLYNLRSHISKLYQLKMTQQQKIAVEWSQLSSGLQVINSRSSSVSPLLITTWNQSPYYNNYCPVGSVTGCVATAMAQIVKYWNYPTTGTGSYSYSDAPYGTLSSSFDSTINWSIMPNSLSSGTPTNETNAVASLMYKLGVSVAMSYSPSGSGAYVLQSENPGGQCAQYSYVNYFGYNANTIQGLVQANYTTNSWDSIIDVELNNSRPIEYVGFGVDGGHTWVVDGYNSSGLYDMNWGWGGLDDGYYALNDLDPSGIPLGSDNAMLVGIEPGSAKPSCSEPTSLAANSITTSSAVISWVGSGSAKSYNLNYEVSGASSWTSVTGITSESYTLSGLAAGTTYNIEVQQECTSGGSSSFTSAVSFSTVQPTCNEPASLAASGITTSSAVISWTGSGSAKSYNLNYEVSGASSWTSVTGITSESYTLNGIASGTTYNAEVQQECTSGGTSGFTNIVSFSTLQPNCNVPTSLAAGSITTSGAVISWVGSGSPESYTLNFKESGATSWSSITGITSESYSLSDLTAGTTYNIEVQQVCSNSESSSFTSTVSFSTAISYCTSSGTTTSEYIKTVKFGSINNTVSNDGGYHNYTNLSTDATAGSSYRMTVAPGFASTSYTEYWSIFIDYNQTGDFVLVKKGKGTGSLSSSITIPTTALNGSTRMRVIMHRGSYINTACSSFTDGDVQDYTVVISNTADVTLQANDDNTPVTEQNTDGISVNVYPNPTNSILNINYLNATDVSNITLVDATGKILLESQSKLERLDLSKYAQGWYILVITGSDGSISRKLIMVAR